MCVCGCVCGPRAITKDHDVCRVLTYIDWHLVRLCPLVQEGDHPKWEHSEASVVVKEPVLVSICVRRTDDSGLWKCFTYHFLSKCLREEEGGGQRKREERGRGKMREEEGRRGRRREEEGGGRKREEEGGRGRRKEGGGRGRKREEEGGGGRRREKREEEGDKGVQVHAIRRLTNFPAVQSNF